MLDVGQPVPLLFDHLAVVDHEQTQPGDLALLPLFLDIVVDFVSTK
jgi:hypothetical protein